MPKCTRFLALFLSMFLFSCAGTPPPLTELPEDKKEFAVTNQTETTFEKKVGNVNFNEVIEWREVSERTQLEILAQREDKFVFAYFYKDNCDLCKYVDSVLEDPEIISVLNDRFISVKVNVVEYPTLYYMYVTPAFDDYPLIVSPSFAVVSPQGKGKAIRGVVDESRVLSILDNDYRWQEKSSRLLESFYE